MFRTGGASKRRDASEGLIVDALRRVGARVWRVGGRGLPDVLVFYRWVFTPMEIKTGTGRLTAAQTDIPWPVVRTVDEALKVIGAAR
jgi:hypothetical protein